MTRTSSYEALKKAKMHQEKLIEASTPKPKIENGPEYSTDIPKLHITIGPGRFATAQSMPRQQEPLADTDHAPRKSSVCKGALRNDQKR